MLTQTGPSARSGSRSAVRDFPAVRCGRSSFAVVAKAFGMKGGERSFAAGAQLAKRYEKADVRQYVTLLTAENASEKKGPTATIYQ